jgi:hypothetical protein
MNRSRMICSACAKFDGTLCRLNPTPLPVDEPATHWCSHGMWHQWSERYQEMQPYFWGEWQDTPVS